MKSIRELFMERISNYKSIDIDNIISIKDLEKLGEGIYIINKIPPVNLIKKFSNIYNCSGEVSLICIENVWMITISSQKVAYVPAELDNYIRKGSVKFFAHSHPTEHNGEQFPSFNDLQLCDSIDRKIYIISYLGIMEVDISSVENFDYLEERFENYLWDNHISSKEYHSNPDKIFRGFLFSLGCNIKIISYEMENEINNLLQSKMHLEDDFWNISKEWTSYPGRKK